MTCIICKVELEPEYREKCEREHVYGIPTGYLKCPKCGLVYSDLAERKSK